MKHKFFIFMILFLLLFTFLIFSNSTDNNKTLSESNKAAKNKDLQKIISLQATIKPLLDSMTQDESFFLLSFHVDQYQRFIHDFYQSRTITPGVEAKMKTLMNNQLANYRKLYLFWKESKDSTEYANTKVFVSKFVSNYDILYHNTLHAPEADLEKNLNSLIENTQIYFDGALSKELQSIKRGGE